MTSNLGFVGGGQMATALAGGACSNGLVKEAELVFAEPSKPQQEKLRARFPDAKIVDHARELADECDMVILSIKPHVLKAIASELASAFTENHLLISIAAGIALSNLQELLRSKRVIRVMPNTPCQVGEGASAISADPDVSEQDLSVVEKLMASVGKVEQVPDQLIHAVTGVAGSSPAYIYMVIEALSDGGVLQGLPRETATKLAAQAVLGAAKMVLDTGLHPGALKDQVTSPGGTTIAAIRELEAGGLRSSLIEAVAACAERSEELG